MMDSLAQSTRAKKGSPHSIWLYKSVGILTETGVFWKPRHPLKGPVHKISFTATHHELCQKEGKAKSGVIQRQTGMCGSGEGAEGTTSRFPMLSPYIRTPTDSISSSTPLYIASA